MYPDDPRRPRGGHPRARALIARQRRRPGGQASRRSSARNRSRSAGAQRRERALASPRTPRARSSSKSARPSGVRSTISRRRSSSLGAVVTSRRVDQPPDHALDRRRVHRRHPPELVLRHRPLLGEPRHRRELGGRELGDHRGEDREVPLVRPPQQEADLLVQPVALLVHPRPRRRPATPRLARMLTGRGAKPQTNLHTYERARGRVGRPAGDDALRPARDPDRRAGDPRARRRARCSPAAPTSIPRPPPPSSPGPFSTSPASPSSPASPRPRRASRIGACTPWAAIRDAALPPACDALRAAAAEVGGRQIQNAGTIGGNLCNASPAADGVPPLLGARRRGRARLGRRPPPPAARRLPPRRPRATARRPDEILTAVLLPAAALAGRSAFLKLGARALPRHLDRHGRRPPRGRRRPRRRRRRSPSAPAARSRPACRRSRPASLGARPTPASPTGSTRPRSPPRCAPIDDVRATAAYRAEAAAELLRRAVAAPAAPA